MDPSLAADRIPEGLSSRATRGGTGAVLGLMSTALLLASFRWAHHWGPISGAIVAAWAVATISAFVVSVRSLRRNRSSRRFAMMGIALTLVSLLVLTLVGALYATGTDVSGACGGG
jgi:hypothetical protein